MYVLTLQNSENMLKIQEEKFLNPPPHIPHKSGKEELGWWEGWAGRVGVQKLKIWGKYNITDRLDNKEEKKISALK